MSPEGEIERGPRIGIPGGAGVIVPRTRLEDPLTPEEHARYAAVLQGVTRPAPAEGPAVPRGLVMEDDPYIRDIVGFVLRSWGFEVLESADGVEALRRLATTPVDVLVADLRLPGLDGYAVIRGARAFLRLDSMFIVVVTALPGEGPEIAALDSGGDVILRKPFKLDRLAAYLKPIARRRLANGNRPPAA